MIASKPLEVTFICKEKHLKIDVADIGLDELLAKLKAALPDIDMRDRELTYIDDDGDCITIEEQSDWQAYIEYAIDSDIEAARSLLLFDKSVNDKLRSMIDRGVKHIAKTDNVKLDDCILEDIVDDVKNRRETFSKKQHDELSGNDLAVQKAAEEAMQKDIEVMVQDRITKGEFKLSPQPSDATMIDDQYGIVYCLTRAIDGHRERRARRMRRWAKIQKKGLKIVKRQVRKIGEIGVGVFKAVRNAFNL